MQTVDFCFKQGVFIAFGLLTTETQRENAERTEKKYPLEKLSALCAFSVSPWLKKKKPKNARS